MSDSLISKPESTAVCDCQEWMRSACSEGPFNGGLGGKRYCVLHSPDTEKSEAFKEALKEKLDKVLTIWFLFGLLYRQIPSDG